MKKTTLLALLLCLQYLSYGQKETLIRTEYFKDYDEGLINDTVLIFDSVSIESIMQKFENWGGKNFKNYEAVRVQKSDNQIVLRYITNDKYIRLVAMFKEGKLRLQFYDDKLELVKYFKKYKPWKETYETLDYIEFKRNGAPGVHINGYGTTLLLIKLDLKITILSIQREFEVKKESKDW